MTTLSPPPTPSDSTAEAAAGGTMVALLTRQRDLYRLLLDLAHKQRDAIEREDTAALLQLLSTRGRVMTQLAQMQERVGELQAQPPIGDLADRGNDPERAAVRALVEEVTGLLETIIEGDDQDRQRLLAGRDDLRRRIGQVRQAGAAAHRYGQTAAAAAPGSAGIRTPAPPRSPLRTPSLTDFQG